LTTWAVSNPDEVVAAPCTIFFVFSTFALFEPLDIAVAAFRKFASKEPDCTAAWIFAARLSETMVASEVIGNFSKNEITTS